MTENNYTKCLDEMFGLRRFGIKLGLDVIRNILNNLKNPEQNFSCIHIAGTNGKGSIASALATILHASGYKTGLYTSPHLVTFNERICINSIQISNDDVITSYQAVKTACRGMREPTFFEYTTAMALYQFAKSEVDWAVIETGMGGRLDATNILCPNLSIVTNISLEHRSYLGNTIAEIAGEKGGIIKAKTPVVTGVTQKNAITVIKEIASKKSAPLYRLKKHFHVRRNQNGRFSYSGIDHQWQGLKTNLPGGHQIDNAALVLAACEVLQQQNVLLQFDTIKNCLKTYKWPGRLEIIDSSPIIIIDGAHNLMAARYLSKFLKKNLADKDITLIIGVLDDKPYESILKSLLPNCNRVILTRPEIDRSLSPETLYPYAAAILNNTEIVADVGDAVNHALDTTPPDAAICIAGSLYVVGEAKQALEIRGVS